MDVSVVRDRIQATLSADANVRRQAELDLKFVRLPPARPPKGALPTCVPVD